MPEEQRTSRTDLGPIARARAHHRRSWRTTMNVCAGSSAVAVALLAFALSSTNALATTPKKSLYERLGGYNAIVAVDDDFVANVAADKRINKFFARANVGRLKSRLVEQ